MGQLGEILTYIVRPIGSALKHISPVQKYEQPTLVLRLHASIRRQIHKGARDPLSIAAEALKEVYVRQKLGGA